MLAGILPHPMKSRRRAVHSGVGGCERPTSRDPAAATCAYEARICRAITIMRSSDTKSPRVGCVSCGAGTANHVCMRSSDGGRRLVGVGFRVTLAARDRTHLANRNDAKNRRPQPCSAPCSTPSPRPTPAARRAATATPSTARATGQRRRRRSERRGRCASGANLRGGSARARPAPRRPSTQRRHPPTTRGRSRRRGVRTTPAAPVAPPPAPGAAAGDLRVYPRSRRHRVEDDPEKPGVLGDDPTDGTMLLLPEGGGGGGEEFMFERASRHAPPMSPSRPWAPLPSRCATTPPPPTARAAPARSAHAGALDDDDDGHALDATDEAVGGEGLALSLGQAMTAPRAPRRVRGTSRRRSSVLLAAAQDTTPPPPGHLVEVGADASADFSARRRRRLAAGSEGGAAAGARAARIQPGPRDVGGGAAAVAEDVNELKSLLARGLRGARASPPPAARGRRRAHRAHRSKCGSSPPPRRGRRGGGGAPARSSSSSQTTI